MGILTLRDNLEMELINTKKELGYIKEAICNSNEYSDDYDLLCKREGKLVSQVEELEDRLRRGMYYNNY